MNDKYMLDKNGRRVTAGARVRFRSWAHPEPRLGWVRTVRNDGHLARVDDGDQQDTHVETLSISTWVTTDEIEVVS